MRNDPSGVGRLRLRLRLSPTLDLSLSFIRIVDFGISNHHHHRLLPSVITCGHWPFWSFSLLVFSWAMVYLAFFSHLLRAHRQPLVMSSSSSRDEHELAPTFQSAWELPSPRPGMSLSTQPTKRGGFPMPVQNPTLGMQEKPC